MKKIIIFNTISRYDVFISRKTFIRYLDSYCLTERIRKRVNQ